MRSAVILAIGALAPFSLAQTVTLPASAIGAAGGSANYFPWGSPATGWPGLRIQCLYDSSHFTAAPTPVNVPVLITNVRWRADDAFLASWAGGTYSQATLSLGTAAVDYSAASTTWTSNVGPDFTQVYSGVVTVQPGTASPGVPGPFLVDITLTTPFLYDPNLGDLVVDTDFATGAWSGGTQAPLDVMTTGQLASRVYASTLYPNANGVDAAAPVIEIGFIPASGTFATNSTLGVGCVRSFNSVYETLGNATVASTALTGNVLMLVPHATGYQGTWLPGTAAAFYTTPVSPTVLPVGDDGEVTVTPTIPLATPYGAQSQLRVTGNAIIGFGGAPMDFPGTFSYTPTPNGMLNSIQGGIYAWHDYNAAEAGSGPVQSEEIGGTLYITFNDVENYSNPLTTNRSTMQFQLDLASGLVRIVWLSIDSNATSAFGSTHLVGVTAPGASGDPGSIALATASAAQLFTSTPETLPLALAGTTRPVIGTSWNLSVTNVPPTGVIGLDIFGFSDPGINDLFFIGMPGCPLRTSLDVLLAWPVTGATHNYGLTVPNNPSLVNAHVFTTSAVLQSPPVNTFGAITSNGIDGKIGDV